MIDGKTVLSVEKLGIARGSFSLRGVSFELAEGEILALLGKTGVGKTMLLETVAGLSKPTEGCVLYRGHNVLDIALHRRNIGYLCQDYSLFPRMTARQNIGYGLKMHRMSRADIRAETDAIAERFGIAALMEQYPGTLSGGEQQRVALARALITRPPLLLLDEPFSALDPRTRHCMYELLREIRGEFRCAVIFVTHDFPEAQTLADRVAILAGGEFCGAFQAVELYTAPWPEAARRLLGLETG